MSKVAFGLLGCVFISTILASLSNQLIVSGWGRGNERFQLALGVVANIFLFTALTVVPMFHFNGLISLPIGVLVTVQAGVMMFAWFVIEHS